MKIKLEDIYKNVSKRPEGYLENTLSKGIVKDGFLIIDNDSYYQLVKQYNPQALSVNKPVPCGCGNKPKQPLKMPPMFTQVKNAAKAVSRVVSNVAQGKPVFASEDVIAKRKENCNGCEWLDKAKNRCSKCGCRYEYKIKLVSESCPLKYWA
jgi:hypothetical protein